MLYKRVLLIFFLSLLSSVVLTVIGLLYIEHINMADFAATRYGFPYWWLMHITVTIAGSTDIWRSETLNLVKDIVLFFLLSLGLWSVILLLKHDQRTSRNME